MKDGHHFTGECNDMTGFMSYGKNPYRWSECSKEHFMEHYHKYIVIKERDWCLAQDSTACNGYSPEMEEPVCSNIWSDNFCEIKLEHNRCHVPSVRRKCNKSCDVC